MNNLRRLRTFCLTLATVSSIIITGCVSDRRPAVATVPAPTNTPALPAGPGLYELAENHNISLGVAVQSSHVRFPAMAGIIAQEFGSLTAENEMKIIWLKGDEEEYDFEGADQIVSFAGKHNMKMRGHTLVWHSAVPEWMSGREWNKKEVMTFLQQYINTVVTHYKKRVYCWDVVNEVFSDNGSLRGSGDSFWAEYCGEDYIANAFIWAHEADPDALLFINDYGINNINAKSTALYEYVKKLLAAGVPVHGVGMQLHMQENVTPAYDSIRENIRRFAELGLEVHFTELDVRIPQPVTSGKLEHQAEVYTRLFELAISSGQVANITIWGLTDAQSWVDRTFPSYTAPLLFDEMLKPKQAYLALKKSLSGGGAPPETAE